MSTLSITYIAVQREVERQDRIHPEGYPPSRDGVRLGIATVADELDEALGAWRDERRSDGWVLTEQELIQTVAVALRLIRSVADDAEDREERFRSEGFTSLSVHLVNELRVAVRELRDDRLPDACDADLMEAAADALETLEASRVKPGDVQRRLALIESGDYSVVEMAHDLESLARRPDATEHKP